PAVAARRRCQPEPLADRPRAALESAAIARPRQAIAPILPAHMVPAVERDLVALVGDLTKERRRAGADREGRQERPGQERADTVEPERIRAPHLEEETRPERAPDRRARPARAPGAEEPGAEGRAPEEAEQSAR